MYKIYDDNIKPRQFLKTDSEDRIQAILSKWQGHSLYEFIDSNDPLHLFINFDLSKKKFDKLNLSLSLQLKKYRIYFVVSLKKYV